MARRPSSAIHSRSIRASAGRPALGQLLPGEQAGLDPLGQLDFLLGVEQRHLADLLQVVLDRVRAGARHRHPRGGKIIVVVAEDEDLLVLAAAIRGQLDHAGARVVKAHGVGVRGRLPRLGALGVPGPVRYFRPVDVAGQIAGFAEAGLAQVLLGQHRLEVGVVGVEIAKVTGIRGVQIRVSTETRRAGVNRDQAAAGGRAQPRTVIIRVPGTRTTWPRSHLNRLILNGPRVLVRDPGAIPLALGHLPAVTLHAAPGFASPGIPPAHPPRLFDHQPPQRHRQPRARPSPRPQAPRDACTRPAGPVRPNWPAQAPTPDQNPSSYTSGLQSAGIWLAAPSRTGLVHERDRGRQCSHCPGLRWHPGRIISSHPRSITPAEPARLGALALSIWLVWLISWAGVPCVRTGYCWPKAAAAGWRAHLAAGSRPRGRSGSPDPGPARAA